MRNLAEYPVTLDEMVSAIVGAGEKARAEIDALPPEHRPIGGISGVALRTAAQTLLDQAKRIEDLERVVDQTIGLGYAEALMHQEVDLSQLRLQLATWFIKGAWGKAYAFADEVIEELKDHRLLRDEYLD